MSSQTNMNLEMNRLETFNSWPSSAPVNPARIAKAGFYYTGEGLEVQCFSCNGKISQWNYGDQVMWRHRRLSPNCTFIVDPASSGNVPLVPECSSPESSWTSLDEGEANEVDSITQDYGLTEEDEMYRSTALRFLSFVNNWDDGSVSREALVNAGFYCAGNGRLRCAWCGGELAPFRDFGSVGTPLEVHRMYFPRCDHARTLEAAQQMNMSPSSQSFESHTPPISSPTRDTNEPQSSGAAHNARILNAGSTWRALGVVGGGARHPNQASLASRLATFERWPADRPQSPKALAEAGFFHTGTDDQVRCFYCDGGLGKWEAGDAPWSEHARWFPHCGYVLLVKGQEFVDSCRPHRPQVPVENNVTANQRNPGLTFPVTDSQVDELMESAFALNALSAGLDAARVRRAFVKKLRTTGASFSTAEALIDAVLDEQLNEEPWAVAPHAQHTQRFARDILAHTLREFVAPTGIFNSSQSDEGSDSRNSQSERNTRSPSPEIPIRVVEIPATVPENPPPIPEISRTPEQRLQRSVSDNISEKNDKGDRRSVSLEEENRQLKEARLCKVCMDNEVSVVFLPCGHLVSCGGCGAALAACPLCRAAVKALVRAYLA